ncbi:type I-F CRISPR-associated endoribonuclease Cas6/Csy4 [Nitrosomonas sp. Is37]|uniref:type I-F CRISPR-associated endoribonuclease Cas6/Csy4 n=1 Tax=Nitrosomonas sp. Is37 TaxID=3080535 RepID=UPI00294B852B|nr:type I-F CRISPR-associated endoribonuclease Cas6/Csy4 [Nitrosomonas sp. Is37]MDV6343165.1 type I-F CRISPR-associated endoribonuclease Cas6/Csy4 [Nitrosomonas sp. Is37]
MKYYQELSLLPQEEVSLYFLWSKVFQQIHLGLVEMQDDQKRVPIGVSFPEYVVSEKCSVLGSKLRLFAQDETILVRFDSAKWLVRLSDYVHCTRIRPVPEKLKEYAIYQREQFKTSKERLARRYANRHPVTYDEALLCYNKMTRKSIATPFIRLKSLSNDKMFCLWIRKTIVSEPSGATYSSYGLSTTATVPEF